MNRTIRTILGAGIAFGAFASPVLAQGKSHKADKAEAKAVKTVQKSNGKVTKTYHKGNTTYRRTTTARARALCEDGTVVYRTSNTCANHGGLASNQGTYARYPSASARGRERNRSEQRAKRSDRALQRWHLLAFDNTQQCVLPARWGRSLVLALSSYSSARKVGEHKRTAHSGTRVELS